MCGETLGLSAERYLFGVFAMGCTTPRADWTVPSASLIRDKSNRAEKENNAGRAYRAGEGREKGGQSCTQTFNMAPLNLLILCSGRRTVNCIVGLFG